MRNGLSLLAFVLVWAGFAARGGAENSVPLHENAKVQFLTKEQASAHLTKTDVFIERLSRFDLQVRLQRAGEVSRKQLLEFVGRQTLDWKPEEIEKITTILHGLQQKMRGLAPLFPDEVWLIKTTGKDEADAAYCRSPAVILPQRMVEGGARSLERLLVHELFHILSRRDADRQEKMYEIVGFHLCGPIQISPWFDARRITNPDAPLLNGYANLVIDGIPTKIVPVLYSSKKDYDVKRGGSLFQYLVFQLAEVEQTGGVWRLVEQDGQPVFHDPKTTEDYFAKIGRNTSYIIHPEEVLAENFVHMVLGAKNLKTPEIPKKLRVVLGQKK